MGTVQESELEVGKNYYFSKYGEDFGTFVRRDEDTVYFEPKTKTTFSKNKEGLVEFFIEGYYYREVN